jgi:O-antigen ligase
MLLTTEITFEKKEGANLTSDSIYPWRTRLQEALWLTVAAAIPLAFSPWTYNAFELPKTALLKALVMLMGLTVLIHVIEGRSTSEESKTVIPHHLLWPALAFGGAAALATALSVNPRVSLWGSYERQQGLVTLSAYIGLFLFTAANLRTRYRITRLLTTITWSSTPIVLYALLQAAGIDPMDWQSDAASPVLSTVGRANFLGSWMVLVIPLTAGRMLTAHRRWPYGLLIAGQIACLILTQARGAWIGLGAAVVTWLLALGLARHDRRPIVSALLLLIMATSFTILLNLPDGPLATLTRVPGLDRFATMTRTDAGSSAARLTIWKATLPLIAARPWVGHGPETMQAVFARVFPPELVYYQGRHAVVDRAHNLWLDLGMSTGLAGIAAFAALLAGFGRLAWRGLSNNDNWQKVTWSALTAGVVGHLVDLHFSFDTTASATIFWLTLALGAAAAREHENRSSISDFPISPKALLTYAPPALAVLALIGLLCVRPLMADAAFKQSLQGSQPLERAQRATQLWPVEPIYRLRLAETLAQSGNFAAADSQLDNVRALCADDPGMWAARGNIYALWGNTTSDRYVQAEVAYRQALELAPNIATYHTGLGLVLAQQGRLEEGVAELERAVALDATDGVAFQHLADLYHAIGKDSQEIWARKEAERWNDE